MCGREATQDQHSGLCLLTHSVYLAGKGCKNSTKDAFLLIVVMHNIQWDPADGKHGYLHLGKRREMIQGQEPLQDDELGEQKTPKM